LPNFPISITLCWTQVITVAVLITLYSLSFVDDEINLRGEVEEFIKNWKKPIINDVMISDQCKSD
jgi:hypothetical protein